MTLIDAIRTLRKERGMSFEAARTEAIKHFKKTGREVPSVFVRLDAKFGAKEEVDDGK